MLIKITISKFQLDVFWEMVGMWRGLAPLQSLLTLKRDTSPFNFKSNEPFSKFLWQQIAMSKFLYVAFQENTRWMWQGCIHPPITLNLRKGTRNSDYQSNEPLLKFIQSLFLYKPYIPPGHNLKPLPWGMGGAILEDIISRSFNYAEQNGYLEILIGCIWGMVGMGGVLVALQSLLTIEKGPSPFNYQLNKPFFKFLRQLIQYKVPWSKTKKKTRCAQLLFT